MKVVKANVTTESVTKASVTKVSATKVGAQSASATGSPSIVNRSPASRSRTSEAPTRPNNRPGPIRRSHKPITQAILRANSDGSHLPAFLLRPVTAKA